MVSNLSIEVTFEPSRGFSFRMWIARLLVSLAMKIATGPICEVTISETEKHSAG